MVDEHPSVYRWQKSSADFGRCQVELRAYPWTLESLQFTPVKEKTRNVSFNGIVGAKCLSMTLKRQQAKQKFTFCKKLEILAVEMAWELMNWVLYIWTSVTFSFKVFKC